MKVIVEVYGCTFVTTANTYDHLCKAVRDFLASVAPLPPMERLSFTCRMPCESNYKRIFTLMEEKNAESFSSLCLGGVGGSIVRIESEEVFDAVEEEFQLLNQHRSQLVPPEFPLSIELELDTTHAHAPLSWSPIRSVNVSERKAPASQSSSTQGEAVWASEGSISRSGGVKEKGEPDAEEDILHDGLSFPRIASVDIRTHGEVPLDDQEDAQVVGMDEPEVKTYAEYIQFLKILRGKETNKDKRPSSASLSSLIRNPSSVVESPSDSIIADSAALPPAPADIKPCTEALSARKHIDARSTNASISSRTCHPSKDETTEEPRGLSSLKFSTPSGSSSVDSVSSKKNVLGKATLLGESFRRGMKERKEKLTANSKLSVGREAGARMEKICAHLLDLLQHDSPDMRKLDIQRVTTSNTLHPTGSGGKLLIPSSREVSPLPFNKPPLGNCAALGSEGSLKDSSSHLFSPGISEMRSRSRSASEEYHQLFCLPPKSTVFEKYVGSS